MSGPRNLCTVCCARSSHPFTHQSGYRQSPCSSQVPGLASLGLPQPFCDSKGTAAPAVLGGRGRLGRSIEATASLSRNLLWPFWQKGGQAASRGAPDAIGGEQGSVSGRLRCGIGLGNPGPAVSSASGGLSEPEHSLFPQKQPRLLCQVPSRVWTSRSCE